MGAGVVTLIGQEESGGGSWFCSLVVVEPVCLVCNAPALWLEGPQALPPIFSKFLRNESMFFVALAYRVLHRRMSAIQDVVR